MVLHYMKPCHAGNRMPSGGRWQPMDHLHVSKSIVGMLVTSHSAAHLLPFYVQKR